MDESCVNVNSNEPSRKPWQQSRSGIRGEKVLVSFASMEWYCYALLGIITALMSFFMDTTVAKLLRPSLLLAHQWLYEYLKGHHLLQFLCWTLYPACLCALSTSFAHSICPFFAGFGVPEARAILLGMDMPDRVDEQMQYMNTAIHEPRSPLSFCFMRIRCKFNRRLLMLMTLIYLCFIVIGVLFRKEVMGTHYSVRDYCPCFFAASAITFRLLSVCSRDQGERALFKTSFSSDLPYQPFEIFIFALLVLFCSFLSCIYLFCHHWALHFIKTNKPISRFLATEKSLYSALVAFLLACFTFYHSAGYFIAAESALPGTLFPRMSLSCLNLQKTFWHVGLLVVMFNKTPLKQHWSVLGAAVGHLVGEGSAYSLSDGISSAKTLINLGGYTLAGKQTCYPVNFLKGSCLLWGCDTHTLSCSIGSHTVPTLVATLVCKAKHRPSFYDGISLIKQLPHLPSLICACPKLANVQIKQFVIPAGVVLERTETLASLQHILNDSADGQFPVVDSHVSPILLGTINKSQLRERLHQHRNEGLCKQLEEACSIQPVRPQLTPESTVKQVHVTDEQRLFITESGRLCGVITWKEIKKIIEEMAKEV
uniref:Chloride channel K n=1 Tax=Cyprinus carpio carpio TaxID=630221 RepID=A0A9J7Z5F4_CYPCA